MQYRWVVACKDCKKEFTFQPVDEQHPRQSVSNMHEYDPPKPPLKNKSATLSCPHCGESKRYTRGDLEFRRDA